MSGRCMVRKKCCSWAAMHEGLMLYRTSYQRGTREVSITFAANDVVDAILFQSLWEGVVRAPAVHLQPLGRSKFYAYAGKVQLRKDR